MREKFWTMLVSISLVACSGGSVSIGDSSEEPDAAKIAQGDAAPDVQQPDAHLPQEDAGTVDGEVDADACVKTMTTPNPDQISCGPTTMQGLACSDSGTVYVCGGVTKNGPSLDGCAVVSQGIDSQGEGFTRVVCPKNEWNEVPNLGGLCGGPTPHRYNAPSNGSGKPPFVSCVESGTWKIADVVGRTYCCSN